MKRFDQGALLLLGSLVSGCLVALIASGCGSTPKDDWWNYPQRYEKCLAAIGSSADPDPGQAMREAELNARANLAATLKAHLRSVNTSWTRRAGWGNRFETWINRQEWVEQTVRVSLAGSWPLRYERDGKVLYCLVVLKNPGAYLQKYYERAAGNLSAAPERERIDSNRAQVQLKEILSEEEKRLDRNRSRHLKAPH
jgi:hypothetical protein